MTNLRLNNKNKILFVSHNLEREGATWYLFDLIVGLKKMGFEAKVLSPRSGPLLEDYRREKIEVEIHNFNLDKNYHVRLEDYDLIIVNTIVGYKFIKELDLARNKIIWCIHESEREVYFKDYPDLERALFSKVSKVIFVSEATKRIYSDLGKNNFVVIPNGLVLKDIDAYKNENFVQDIKEKYGFSKKDMIISIIGTVCLRKGQLEFAQAAIKILNKKKYHNLKFLIVNGRGDDYEKRISELICDCSYEKEIKIIKEVPAINDYYRLSDVFVCNSFIESSPRVILEAMAFDLPIIATNVYGIPEQIEDGKEGLLVMAGDINTLADKIEYLIKNKKRAIELGKNGRLKVEKSFTYEKMLADIVNILKSVEK